MHFKPQKQVKLTRRFWATFFFTLGDILLKLSGHPFLFKNVLAGDNLSSKTRVTRLGDLSPFGRLFKALGDNLFGPNRPNFWRLFGQFLKVGQNLKFLCYKTIFKAVNFQKKYFLKYFEKKFGNFFSKKDPKYAFLATKTSKN